MHSLSPRREVAFLIHDVGRLLRTLADQRVRVLNMTRAQWAVLVTLQQREGLKQAELADSLEIKPITLTRLIDRLCASGLVERRPDPDDRRAKRLFLTPAAVPVIDRLAGLGESLMAEVLAGMDEKSIGLLRRQLNLTKDNLRNAIRADALPQAAE